MLKRTWLDFEHTELRKVSGAHCEEWEGRVSKSTSAPRYNAALSMLRSLLEISVESGIRRTNPAAKLKRSRVKFKDLSGKLPTRAEFLQLVDTIRNAGGRFSHDCADYVEFLAYSGVRHGEAKWIQWHHCDFTRGEILITGDPLHGTKNHEVRRIPIIPAMQTLLARLKVESPAPFPADRLLKVTMAKNALNRATAETEISHITHHDLRHFFATICIAKKRADLQVFEAQVYNFLCKNPSRPG